MITRAQYEGTIGPAPREKLRRYAARTARELLEKGVRGGDVARQEERNLQREVSQEVQRRVPRRIFGLRIGTTSLTDVVTKNVESVESVPTLLAWEIARQELMSGHIGREGYCWEDRLLLGEDGALYVREWRDATINGHRSSEFSDSVAPLPESSYEFWDRRHTLRRREEAGGWSRGLSGRSADGYRFDSHCTGISLAIKELRRRHGLP